MTVPADFTINWVTNPCFDGANTTGWTPTNCALLATTAGGAYSRVYACRLTATAAGNMSMTTATGTSGFPVTAGTSYVMQAAFKTAATARATSTSIGWYNSSGTLLSTSTGSTVNDSTSAFGIAYTLATAPAGAAYAAGICTVAAAAASEVHYVDGCMFTASTTGPVTYEDGASAPDSKYRYKWSGTADASTTLAEYRGVWVEVGSGSGCPFAQVYVNGTGTSPGSVTVTRQSDDDVVTVPGWNGRSIVDSDTLPDYACPLGRTVTYTAYLNGIQLNSMQITLTSATGWVQDPFDPTTAMPVEVTLVTTTHLTLAKGSLRNRVHNTNATHASFMGSQRQYSIAGMRFMDDTTQILINAWQNDISDSFRELVSGAPILLFRPLPSWGSIPGLLYMDAPAKEMPLNRDQVSGNYAVTQWDITGPNVVPVSRMPLTGQVTYSQMATNLSGTTYSTIASRSSGKRYVDIKTSPLSL